MSEFKHEMPAQFLSDWLEWLESGEHKQGKGYLFDGTGYCCIGGACKVAGADDSALNDEAYVHASHGIVFKVDLPRCLIGMNHNTAASRYAAMNDDGKTVKEIAAAIRQEVRPI